MTKKRKVLKPPPNVMANLEASSNGSTASRSASSTDSNATGIDVAKAKPDDSASTAVKGKKGNNPPNVNREDAAATGASSNATERAKPEDSASKAVKSKKGNNPKDATSALAASLAAAAMISESSRARPVPSSTSDKSHSVFVRYGNNSAINNLSVASKIYQKYQYSDIPARSKTLVEILFTSKEEADRFLVDKPLMEHSMETIDTIPKGDSASAQNAFPPSCTGPYSFWVKYKKGDDIAISTFKVASIIHKKYNYINIVNKAKTLIEITFSDREEANRFLVDEPLSRHDIEIVVVLPQYNSASPQNAQSLSIKPALFSPSSSGPYRFWVKYSNGNDKAVNRFLVATYIKKYDFVDIKEENKTLAEIIFTNREEANRFLVDRPLLEHGLEVVKTMPVEDSASAKNTQSLRMKPVPFSPSSSGPYIFWIKYSEAHQGSSDLSKFKVASIIYEKYNYTNMENKSKTLVEIIFSDREEANKFLNDDPLSEQDMIFYVPLFRQQKRGLIKGIPVKVTENTILHNIESEFKVCKVERQPKFNKNWRGEGDKMLPSETILLTFESQELPRQVVFFGMSLKVTPYVCKPLLCYSCLNYGHKSTKCNGIPLCSMCGEIKHEGRPCTKQTPWCPHCKAPHKVNDKFQCLEYKDQLAIQVMMTFDSISYKEARDKVKKKVDDFTAMRERALSKIYGTTNLPGRATAVDVDAVAQELNNQQNQSQNSKKLKIKKLIQKENDKEQNSNSIVGGSSTKKSKAVSKENLYSLNFAPRISIKQVEFDSDDSS